MVRGSGVQCLLVNMGMDVYGLVSANRALDIYGVIDVNRWKDRENVQVRVISIEEA